MNVKHPRGSRRGDERLLRMFKHVYNALRESGASDAEAQREAAAIVNKYRAEHGITVERLGRAAARRRGWWPGWRPARELKSTS